MINRTKSPTRASTNVETNSNIQEVKSPSSEIDYFSPTQPSATLEKFGYANQTEVDPGLPGYANKTKSSYANQDYSVPTSGYSNQDAIPNEGKSGYENTDTSNEAQSIVPMTNVPQSLQNLIISIKDEQTGVIKSAYKVCETLTLEEAQTIEQQFGVVLKKHSTQVDKLDGFLGGGAFGRVYVAKEEADFTKQEGTNNSQGKYVAIKIIQGNQKALAESKHESGLQLKLTQAVNRDDSQLMPIIGIGENLSRTQSEAEKLYIVMPLAGMGSGEGLRKDLNELKKSNTSTEFYRLLNLHIAKSMLLGLNQMHRNHIYHLDLKPANMMITGDGRIQLSDFGTSEEVLGNPHSLRVGKDQQSGRFIGNGDSTYFPQERTFYEGSVFNPAKADIYAAGAVLFEFLTGKEFDNHDSLGDPIFNNIAKGSLEELTLRLLNPQSVSRISLEDALNHPCLTVAEAHDESINKVVLGFLGNYVKYTQSKARGDSIAIDQLAQSLKDNLYKSQLQTESLKASSNLVTNPNDPFMLNPTIKVPFANRPDIKEQLQTYLPLKCSQVKTISDPEKQMVSLIDKANEFLANPDKALLLLLADGGAGKSLFVQWLTTNILEQKPPYNDIKSPNGKPYFPLYVTLSNIKNPNKIFGEGLNLTEQSIHELQQTHQVLLIMDGFDEQSYQWKNLFSENKLYNYPGLKVVVTSRINALPGSYSEYFVARQNNGKDLGYQELYLQPFQASQIDTYVANYIFQNKTSIQEQVEQKQLPPQWLEAKYVQGQINSILGLKELMQTPLLSRLVLIALPELNKQQNQAPTTSRKITRAQVYEAFMRQWIITQMRKNNAAKPNAKPKAVEISDSEINQILVFGEKMALAMYKDNCSAQLTVGLQSFSFNPKTGRYHLNPSQYIWFEQGKLEQMLLPLQEPQKGAYEFVHLSMQEYLLARCLINELTQADTLVNLTLNQVTLTIEEKDRPILYFLGDMASMSKATTDKLFALVYQTKTDKTQAIAGANAISVLNASVVGLTHRDFSETNLAYSNLSGGILFNTNFSKANLSNSNLQGTKLYGSNFSQANLSEISLGQSPMFRLEKEIRAICYSPDGRYMAISQNNEVILFDAITRKEVRSFKGHTNEITSISFSGDGTRMVTGSDDSTCRIWDVGSGEFLKVLSSDTHKISSVVISSDGTRVATGGGYGDYNCRIWDVDSGEVLKVLSGHNISILSISFSGDRTRVAAGSYDGTYLIWDVGSGKILKRLNGSTWGFSSISFSGDGTRVATVDKDNTCRIWDVGSGELLKVLSGHTENIDIVSFSPDGTRVVTGSKDKTCRIWDVGSGDVLRILSGHTWSINSVSFSGDGTKVATGSRDKTCRIWDLGSGDVLKILSGHTGGINSVSFSGDGTKVATGSYDKTCRIWDLSSGQVLKVLVGHTERISSVSFSGDGTKVATGNGDNTCSIWDVESGKELVLLRGHTEGIRSVSFSEDGTRLASGSSDNTCRIWDVVSGEVLKVLSGHTHNISKVIFSVDGTRVATGSWDHTCRIWDVGSGELLKVLDGHTDLIDSVSFSSDGTKLITIDAGGTKKIWLVSDGTELKEDQGFLEPQKVYHTFDNVTANYEGNKITLSKKVMTSTNTSTSIESFSIDFPYEIKDISLSKDNVGNKVILTVVMMKGLAFYAKELNAPLSGFVAISLSMIDQVLDASKMDVSASIGLSESNYEVLKQLGAFGEVKKLAEPNQSSMPELPVKDSQKIASLQ